MRQHVGVIVDGQQRVHGHRHDAGVDRAEERDRPFDAVVREQQHALLAAQAVLLQYRRERANAVLELAVRDARALVDVGDAIRAPRIARDEVRRKVER